MAFKTNSLNFPNLTSKSSPTKSDIILISDAAASNVPKQTPFGDFPASTALITTDNSATTASFLATMPGAMSTIQSDSQTQGYGGVFGSFVFFSPFYVGVSWTATKMQTLIKTGVAASTVTMGIYNSLNGAPTGSPITAASIATTASNTLVSATISASLSANTLYWAAIQASTATTLAITMGQLNFSAPNFFWYGSSGSVWSILSAVFSNVYSAGTLPNVGTNASTASLNYNPIIRIV